MAHLVLSVDIEACHSKPGPGRLLSIGASFHDIGRNETILQFSMNIEWPSLEFDKVTIAFWEQHRDALERNRQNTRPPALVAHEFSMFLQACGMRAFTADASLSVLTDNAQFDVGWLEWFQSTYSPSGSTVLKNAVVGSLHKHMIDLGQRVQALHDIGHRLPWHSFTPKTTHVPHTPLSDAVHTIERYVFYLEHMARIKRSHPACGSTHLSRRPALLAASDQPRPIPPAQADHQPSLPPAPLTPPAPPDQQSLADQPPANRHSQNRQTGQNGQNGHDGQDGQDGQPAEPANPGEATFIAQPANSGEAAFIAHFAPVSPAMPGKRAPAAIEKRASRALPVVDCPGSNS